MKPTLSELILEYHPAARDMAGNWVFIKKSFLDLFEFLVVR